MALQYLAEEIFKESLFYGQLVSFKIWILRNDKKHIYSPRFSYKQVSLIWDLKKSWEITYVFEIGNIN